MSVQHRKKKKRRDFKASTKNANTKKFIICSQSCRFALLPNIYIFRFSFFFLPFRCFDSVCIVIKMSHGVWLLKKRNQIPKKRAIFFIYFIFVFGGNFHFAPRIPPSYHIRESTTKETSSFSK